MAKNSRHARQYGNVHTAANKAQPPAASHPRNLRGHPARTSANGNRVTGKALANAPAVSVSVDIAGKRRIINSVATIAAMASASLWPLEANSTTTSGFQA